MIKATISLGRDGDCMQGIQAYKVTLLVSRYVVLALNNKLLSLCS